MNFNKWVLISAIIVLFFIYNLIFSTEVKISPNTKFISNFSGKRNNNVSKTNVSKTNEPSTQTASVAIATKVTLPIQWGDLGKRMVEDGVIDKTKFDKALGNLSSEDKKLIESSDNSQIVMTEENSRVMLDLLWAFGLANKNQVLENGDIAQDPAQIGNFASTGGWTLARGNPMDYFNKYSYVTLDSSQQKMVEEMSRGIYRPCCNNSTYFPDCNHGMAMLGLLELMAKNGVSKEDAYKVALQVNSIWFPQTYTDIAVYFSENGTSIDKINPAEVLSAKYSSASGYRQTRAQIKSLPQPVQGSGGCGI
jgi:hypothetical protein